MNAKTMLGALAACALMAFGCNNNGFRNGRQGTTTSMRGPAGNSLVQQTGEVSGKVADVSKDSFSVKLLDGRTVDLKRSGPTSVGIEKNQQVRALYQLDTDGNKIAQRVTSLGIPTGGGVGGSGISSERGQLEGQITDVGDKDFTVQVLNGKAVKLQKGSAGVSLREGEEVRASFDVDKDGDNIANKVTVLRSGPATSGPGTGETDVAHPAHEQQQKQPSSGAGPATQPGQE